MVYDKDIFFSAEIMQIKRKKKENRKISKKIKKRCWQLKRGCDILNGHLRKEARSKRNIKEKKLKKIKKMLDFEKKIWYISTRSLQKEQVERLRSLKTEQNVNLQKLETN